MKKYIILLLIPILTFANPAEIQKEKQTFVINSPIDPWHANNGKALIVKFSSMNFDEKILDAIKKHPEVKTPFVNLSGKLENITSGEKKSNTKTMQVTNQILSSKIHLTSIIEKNLIAHIGFSFKFNKQGKAATNLERALITLDTSNTHVLLPDYITLAQMTMPFGMHSSNQLSDATISSIASKKGQLFKLGYKFTGNSNMVAAIDNNNIVAINLSHKIPLNNITYSFGLGYINKLKVKMHLNNNAKANEINLRDSLMPFVSVEYKKVGIRGEFVTAINNKKLNSNVLAFKTETYYSFKAWGKDANAAIAYEQKTNKDIDYNLPLYRINATFNIIPLKYIYSSLEVKYETLHDKVKNVGVSIKIGALF